MTDEQKLSWIEAPWLALKKHSIDIHFGDYKCSGSHCLMIPDVVGLSNSDSLHLRLIGELKVPWVKAHCSACFLYEGLRLPGWVYEHVHGSSLGRLTKWLCTQTTRH